MTQNDQILGHLKRYGTITQLEATREYGILRLPARAHELRRAGHKIGGYMCRVKTRYGAATVKRYYLVKNGRS